MWRTQSANRRLAAFLTSPCLSFLIHEMDRMLVPTS